MFVTIGRSSMTTKAGVGMSRHHNPNVAAREAATQALQNAGIAKPEFVFMFASIGYDQPSLVRAVHETTGGAPLTGCSAEGTINGDDADESNFSVVVTAISSEELRWHNGIVRGLVEDDTRAVGKRVAKELLPTLLLRPLACSSSLVGALTSAFLGTTLITSLRGWKRISRASASSQCGVGELIRPAVGGSHLINIAMTKSSPVGSPTRCS